MLTSVELGQRGLATPKFAVEIAVAALLTLGALILVARYATGSDAPSVKVSKQAEPLKASPPVVGDAATIDFMEKFALSRIAAPAPETSSPIVPAVATTAIAASMIAAKAASAPIKERVRTVALKNPPAPMPVPRAVERSNIRMVEARRPLAPVSAQKSNSIPILSAITERIPTGREIANGMTSFGRKVGSIFSRG